MASRAARAAARQKNVKVTDPADDIEYIGESHQQKAGLNTPVAGRISRLENTKQSLRKKVETPLGRKLQGNSVRKLRGEKKGESDDSPNEDIEEIYDNVSNVPNINRKETHQQKILRGRTRGQRNDDSDVCSIDEIDGEQELLEKDSKQRVLKDIMEMRSQNEAEAEDDDDDNEAEAEAEDEDEGEDDEAILVEEQESTSTIKSTGSIEVVDGERELLEKDSLERGGQSEAEDDVATVLWDGEQESKPTTESRDPNKETNDEDLEVVWSKISELDSSGQGKDIGSSTLAVDSKENLTKKEPQINTYEDLSQDIQVKKDDNEITCEKKSPKSPYIPSFKRNENTGLGRPWAGSAKDWVAKPVEKVKNSEIDSKHIGNVQNYESDSISKIKRKQENYKSKDKALGQQREYSVSTELGLQPMKVRAEVHQKDISSNDNSLEKVSPKQNNESESQENIDEELFLHPDEEDLLMETTSIVGTDVNLDDAHIEKINDSNDQDFIEETVSNMNETDKNSVHEDIPNVSNQQGLYYKDHFQYRVENFEGMCEDEFHRIIVADEGVFSPKPNNRFSITLITVDKGGLDFVGVALRETLTNLASEKSEKFTLIRFVCGLCNIVHKYKYNKINGKNIPCCGDCGLWSVRGDFENFYEDYNKLWKSIQSEFPEAVFIPTALPSINVKNISIFNQHEYCCPHLQTHFSMSGQLVDDMQTLFNKSIKFINPALNNLCFEMGFQRLYWTKEKNRSRWAALMKAMQTDCVVARNLQIQKKFTPGDSQSLANVDPKNIVNIDNEVVNQESLETDTTLHTGISSDNLLSSSTSPYDHASTTADNSKAPTHGDLLPQLHEKRAERFGLPLTLSEEAKKAARAARFGISETADKTDDVNNETQNLDTTTGPQDARTEGFGLPLSEEAKKAARAARFGIVETADMTSESMSSREQNENLEEQHEELVQTEDMPNEQGINRSSTADPNKELDESRTVSPKRSWRKNSITSDSSSTIGNYNSGNNWKGNTWKHNQSSNQPWYNNPMWRNNYINNNKHYNNNNNSWSNNRPWNNKWNGSSTWSNHSYNQNNYRSYGSGDKPWHRRNWKSNQNNNKRKWNDGRNVRNVNDWTNAKQSKSEIPPSSNTDTAQSELKEDDSQGQNLPTPPTFHSESQQQNLPSTSQQSNNMPSDVPPTSNQDAVMSQPPEPVRVKDEQSPGCFQRIARIKREPGNTEYWPEDAPMFTIKRGPIEDYRPLKDELKDEQSV